MTLNLTIPENINDTKPKISVIGIGGAGGNAINTMINANINNIDFIAANTDGQALSRSLTARQIQLGKNTTLGLGAGSDSETGRKAAEESIEEIIAELGDVNMLFITTGMGGGTGSGAAPVIAKTAREKGILTVAVVTKPFDLFPLIIGKSFLKSLTFPLKIMSPFAVISLLFLLFCQIATGWFSKILILIIFGRILSIETSLTQEFCLILLYIEERSILKILPSLYISIVSLI